PINAILLTFAIVFLFGISESIVAPRNGSFEAVKLQPGSPQNSLNERGLMYALQIIVSLR
ncbi:20108_t:CDS:1, partial [Dentiscutata erythropus]